MSILDTFFILFESDASKLDKGLSESEKKASNLTGKLGLVDQAAGKLGGSLLSSLAGFAAVAAASVGVAALSQAMFDAAAQADKLDEVAGRLEVDIGFLSSWGDLVKKSGGSAEGFASSIEGLNKQLTQVEVTGKSRAAPFLKELGIDLDDVANKGKSAVDFLPQLADAFAGLGMQKALALGSRLGLDQATIMTLQAGSREVESLLAKERELGVITKEQGEISAKFNDQMDDTAHAFRSIWLGVSEFVLPPLTWMMHKFQEVAQFARKHSDAVVGLLIAIGAAITVFVLPPLISMAVSAVVAFAPFIIAAAIVAALAAAFALLYEDIMAFIDGGDSMIGAIVGRWPIIGTIVKAIIDQFKLLFSVGEAIGQFMAKLWDDPAQAFSDFLNLIINGIKTIVNALPGLSTVLGALGIDTSIKTTGGAVAAGQAAVGQASASPLAAQTSGSISNSKNSNKNTSVQVGKVEVQTQATDAAGISRAIGGSLETQMRQAVNNFDDGVLG